MGHCLENFLTWRKRLGLKNFSLRSPIFKAELAKGSLLYQVSPPGSVTEALAPNLGFLGSCQIPDEKPYSPLLHREKDLPSRLCHGRNKSSLHPTHCATFCDIVLHGSEIVWIKRTLTTRAKLQDYHMGWNPAWGTSAALNGKGKEGVRTWPPVKDLL